MPRSLEPTPDGVFSSASRADRKSTRLNSSHSQISYAVFCLKKKKSIIDVEDLPSCDHHVIMLHLMIREHTSIDHDFATHIASSAHSISTSSLLMALGSSKR